MNTTRAVSKPEVTVNASTIVTLAKCYLINELSRKEFQKLIRTHLRQRLVVLESDSANDLALGAAV